MVEEVKVETPTLESIFHSFASRAKEINGK